ncbi:hypothetical protein CYLTODRAFT_31443 [Cylindrobasidium torrendii FP15055 ss-10]|uniref:Uncharacterized protein n=1 Tax=Cylindrobasidium torrendii FP15055 ss-10 TaxID=1314674 RepID=A0A0D7B8D8_9AGAR|nr:hypothetical protein CYLTODRAFT_31443 [Cylindrobasidium torrendii FP15055 ss-10]
MRSAGHALYARCVPSTHRSSPAHRRNPAAVHAPHNQQAPIRRLRPAPSAKQPSRYLTTALPILASVRRARRCATCARLCTLPYYTASLVTNDTPMPVYRQFIYPMHETK